jgi:hypothetical protein
VAGFLGLGNVMEGKIIGKAKAEKWEVESGLGVFIVRCKHAHQKGEKVHLLARPRSAEAERDANLIHGAVSDVIFQQDRFKVTLENGLYIYLPQAPKVGEKIDVRVKVECLA